MLQFFHFQDVVATGRGVQKRVRSDLVLRNEPECGITKHRQFSKRIIGGEKAQFAELPWQVGHNFEPFWVSCKNHSEVALKFTE